MWFFRLYAVSRLVFRHLVSAVIGAGIGMLLVSNLPGVPVWLRDFAAPVGAVIGLWWYHESQKYRDYSWTPLPNGPPRRLRSFAEQHTQQMLDLGLQTAGDFRLRRAPMPTSVRVFTSAEGDLVGLLECVGPFRAVAFNTIFDDGAGLETSNLTTTAVKPGLAPQGKHLWFNVQSGATPAAAHASHRKAIEYVQFFTGAAPLCFPLEDFRRPIDHIHRINYWRMYEEGLASPPRLPKAGSGGESDTAHDARESRLAEAV